MPMPGAGAPRRRRADRPGLLAVAVSRLDRGPGGNGGAGSWPSGLRVPDDRRSSGPPAGSSHLMKAAFIALATLLCGGAAMADDQPAEPTSLLFEAPQWAKTRPGATLTYRYARKSA